MRTLPLVLILAGLALSACTVDENGIRDPVAEAKALATRTASEITRKNAEVDLSIREQVALAEVETKEAELKLRQVQAEADAYRARVMADAEAEASKSRLVEQGKVGAQVLGALGYALSGALVCAALAGSTWVMGNSAAQVYNAAAGARYVKIGVEPVTLLPPPLVIADGFMIDTRTGERARLRDAVGVDRLRLAATTQATNVALLARAAVEIGKSKTQNQAADVLPGIAQSVPLLEVRA